MTEAVCVTCKCSEQSCESCRNPDECSNCITCCCATEHVSWRQKRIHDGLLLEYASVGWMLVEVIGSLAAGILASSFALLAFGGDSLIELISSTVVIVHLKKDSAGSSALGERTSLVTSLLLFSLIPTIAIGSAYSYFTGKIEPETSPLGIAIAVGAVVIMPILWHYKAKIGRQTGCLPLTIDALESETCFLMSIALLGGLVVEYLFKIPWVDYVATAIILSFVAKEAWESFAEMKRENAR